MELIKNGKYLYNSYNSKNIYIEINISEHDSDSEIKNYVDLSSYFLDICDQKTRGITSSCAISSLISYYMKKLHNIDICFSPYFLAYKQYLYTHSWEMIDIATGLNICKNIGICSNNYFDETTKYENINENIIISDANKYKISSFNKINLTIDNIEKLLNDNIPIICSIKIVPTIDKYSMFYEHFLDDKYWKYVYDYYFDKTENEIYAISIVIVGYDNTNRTVKLRGCWGANVGPLNNGYFIISYDVINSYSPLFFDHFVVDMMPFINNSQDNLELCFELINNSFDDDNVFFKLKDGFKKVDSSSDLNSSMINIESFDNLSEMLAYTTLKPNRSMDVLI